MRDLIEQLSLQSEERYYNVSQEKRRRDVSQKFYGNVIFNVKLR